MQLTDRTARIIGATSGIGLGWARRLAAANTVVVAGRRTRAIIPSVEIDVTNDASVVRARDEILQRWLYLDMVTASGLPSPRS